MHRATSDTLQSAVSRRPKRRSATHSVACRDVESAPLQHVAECTPLRHVALHLDGTCRPLRGAHARPQVPLALAVLEYRPSGRTLACASTHLKAKPGFEALRALQVRASRLRRFFTALRRVFLTATAALQRNQKDTLQRS